jgi:hypothetical protein
LSTTGLVPIAAASRRLGRTPWTLKRWYREGILPVVISQEHWFVPESFLAMVDASPQPKRAGQLEDIAAEWFATYSAPAAQVIA